MDEAKKCGLEFRLQLSNLEFDIYLKPVGELSPSETSYMYASL